MIGTLIKLSGDSRDAQRAFRQLANEIDETQRSMSGFAREAASTGFGVLGAGSIDELLTGLYDRAIESLEMYVERNQEAAQVIEGTRHALTGVSDAFWGAAFSGQNLEVIMGAINHVAANLASVIQGNSASLQTLTRDGFATLLEVIPYGIGLFNAFANTIDILRISFNGIKASIQIATLALSDLGLLIGESILSLFRDLVNGAADVVSQLSSFARAVNVGGAFDGLIGQLDRASDAMHLMGAGADSTVQDIRDLRGAIGTEYSLIADGLDEFNQRMMDNISDRDSFLISTTDLLSGLADEVRSGESAQYSYSRSVSDVTSEMQDQAATLEDLTDLVSSYTDEVLGFFAAYKTRGEERVAATRAMLDSEMAAYTAYQDKIVELAQARADAEAGAQMKIEDSISRTREAYDRWASSSVDAFELALAGQQTFAEAARASIGDVVAGLAGEIRARAIAAGATGNFGAAAALGAASVAIGTIAKSLGASQGGGGGGGGGGAGPTQINNVDVRVVGGVFGPNQDQIRQVGEAVNQAIDRGVLRI